MAGCETRRVVRNSALQCLDELARVQPDLFCESDVTKLVDLTQDSAIGEYLHRNPSYNITSQFTK